MSWREEITLGKAYIEELYIGVYPGSLLSGDELGYLDGVVPGTVAAEKAVVVNDSKDIFGFGSLDADRITASGGTLRVGEETVQEGRVDIYGAPTGDSAGGELWLHTAEDETTVEEYTLKVEDTDLVLGKGDVGAVMTYRHTFGDMEFATDVQVSGGDLGVGEVGVSQGRLTLSGSPSGDSDGGRLRINSSTDETTSQYMQLMWEDADFVIRTDDADWLTFNIGTATVDLGANNNDANVLRIYGSSSGNSDGGQLRLSTPADETTHQHWMFRVISDNQLVVNTVNGGLNNAFEFDPSGPQIQVQSDWTFDLQGGFELSGNAVNASAAELNTKEFTVKLEDLSSGGTAYIACPVAGTVTRIDSVVTGDPGGVSTTALNVNGGTSMTATLVIANGAVAGERDTASPVDNNTVAVGDAIHLVFDATPVNNVDAYVTLTVTL